jgi:tRNA threonylcarbamoyladenosine biosynthesis protein TsaE
MNDQSGIRIISSSPLETKKLGELLGQTIRQGVVIGLMGELGAGKTTFAQGLARGLGVQARITSPTFTLINEYTVPMAQARGLGPPLAPQATDKVRLFHVDSYRLAVNEDTLANEIYGLGMDEIFDAVEEESFDNGGHPLDPAAMRHVVVVEWADRLGDLLPVDRLMLRFDSGADGQTPMAEGFCDSTRMHLQNPETDQARLACEASGDWPRATDHDGSERMLCFCATGPRSRALLSALRTAVATVQWRGTGC